MEHLTKKKRKSSGVVAPTTKFIPDEGFELCSTSSNSQLNDVMSENCELWLIQLPKKVSLSSLQGTSFEPASKRKKKEIAYYKDASGAEYVLREEAAALAQQMYALAPGKSGGSCLGPITKRVTLAAAPPVEEDSEEELVGSEIQEVPTPSVEDLTVEPDSQTKHRKSKAGRQSDTGDTPLDLTLSAKKKAKKDKKEKSHKHKDGSEHKKRKHSSSEEEEE